jgi:putative transposase
MIINKGYKYRIYPSAEQKVLLEKTFGCCRFVYNHMLSERQNAWKNDRKTLTKKDARKPTGFSRGMNCAVI